MLVWQIHEGTREIAKNDLVPHLLPYDLGMEKSTQRTLAKLLAFGGVTVTLLVSSVLNYDPVNVPKLLLTAGIGFAVWAILFADKFQGLLVNSRILLFVTFAFLFFGMSAVVFSSSPLEQNIFGAFGRNTGFLVYFSLSGILLGAALIRDRKHFAWMIRAVVVGGIFNVIYCGIDLLGPDIFGFNNVYGHILGTFGNPNFISAYLGMFLVMGVAFIFDGTFGWKIRMLSILIAVVTFFEIIKSAAIQGLAVTGAGLAIMGFYLIRSKSTKTYLLWSYTMLIAVAGSFALAGALQMGPLTQYIYKTSVSLRGVYWEVGTRIGLTHPFSGIGFDAYGDYYRKTRSMENLETAPIGVITNASHNVVIDIFANGGFPLLLAYLAMIALALISIVKVTLRKKQYDGVFVSIAAGWACYQLQSLVSINQIGLAIWGWLLTGLVIAYEIATRDEVESIKATPKQKVRKAEFISAKGSSITLAPVLGFIVGILIAVPPFAADVAWRSAVKSGNAETVYNAAIKWPIDTYRLNSIASTFAQNNLEIQALELVRKNIELNPNSYDAWRIYASIPSATVGEKAKATEMMRKLDPLNTKLE